MTIFCLIISTITGSWCFAGPLDFSPPGTCQDTGDVLICQVEAQELPVRPSYYDPYLVHDNDEVRSLQCQKPCEYLGDGTPVESAYGWAAACVNGWYWKHIRIYWPDGYYTIKQCRDHGGDVHPTCGEVFVIDHQTGNGSREYRCYIPIDFLERQAVMGLLLLLDWEIVTDVNLE